MGFYIRDADISDCARITLINIVLLDIVRRLNCKIIKLRSFGSWILFPPWDKKGSLTKDLSVESPGPTRLRCEASSSKEQIGLCPLYCLKYKAECN